MTFMLVCSDIIFIQFWLKVVENKKEKKPFFVLMNTKIAMNTKRKWWAFS